MAVCAICRQEVHRYTVRLTSGNDAVIVCLEHNRGEAGYRPFEKYWDTNIAEQPVFIENDRHREHLMKQQGLSVRPREHLDDLNHRRWKKGLTPVRK